MIFGDWIALACFGSISTYLVGSLLIDHFFTRREEMINKMFERAEKGEV